MNPHSTFIRSGYLLLILLWLTGCDSQSPTPDPFDTGIWATIESTNGPAARHENAYVALGDRFYLLGGRGNRPVEVFDPGTQTWESRNAPPFQMHHFQAVPFEDKIYIIGAFTQSYPDEIPVENVYIYDPSTDVWTEGPEIPADRRRGSAGAVVHDGQIYVVCGIQNGHTDGHVPWLDRFDPKTGAWTRLADAPRARDHFQAVVIDGKLYTAAGRRTSLATNEVFQLTEAAIDVYDIETDSWTTLPSSANLPTLRAGTAAVAYMGSLVVLGGESVRRLPTDGETGPPSAHDEVEAYDPVAGVWTPLPPMIEGRHGTQAIVHNNRIYIAAGSRTLGGTEINSQEVYTP